MSIIAGEQCHVAVKGNEQTVVCEWRKPEVDANRSQQTSDIEKKFSSIPITDSEVNTAI